MDVQDIKNLAGLAKLSLSDDECVSLGKDFSSILGYLDQIKEVEVHQELVIGGTTTNYMREDIVMMETYADVLLEQAPQRHDRFVKVQKIIGGGDE